MADSYRPMRRDRDPPAPKSLADRMTFTNGGDNYRPGGGQNHSEFTFESNHPAPRFPPSGPANGNSRPPARSNRGRGRGRAGHHGPSHHDRNNANGYQRGGRYKKAAPHERALLQHRDDTTEHTYGVSDGPNRFMNIDDMSDHEEADMEVESDASGAGDDAEGQTSNHKVAKTETPRADGNTVPKWSNPDPYTSLPPPSETTGVKRDVVQLIRKAKNQAAEKAIGNNAVAANDDFISFGDDDGTDVGADDKVDEVDDDDSGLRMYEDDEPVPVRSKHTLPPRPVEGSLNEAAYASNMYSEPPRDRYQPSQARRGNKRKVDASVTIVDEWVASSRDNPTPWADDPETYKHLAKDPEKW
jgi:non-canonical poly(A) RNA polymerase PAPD5/7